MKNKGLITYMILFMALTLCACGSSSKQENDLAAKVNEAIKNKDFPTAYEIIDEMLIEGGKDSPYKRTNLEIAAEQLNSKALFAEFKDLLTSEMPVETKAAKIIMAVKERSKANVWRYQSTNSYTVKEEIKVQAKFLEDFISTAKSSGQDELAQKLQTALNATKQALDSNNSHQNYENSDESVNIDSETEGQDVDITVDTDGDDISIADFM